MLEMLERLGLGRTGLEATGVIAEAGPFQIFVLYGAGFSVVIVLAVVFYLRSVSSRRFYVCPHCGERQRVELMDAQHCSSCGSDLQRE